MSQNSNPGLDAEAAAECAGEAAYPQLLLLLLRLSLLEGVETEGGLNQHASALLRLEALLSILSSLLLELPLRGTDSGILPTGTGEAARAREATGTWEAARAGEATTGTGAAAGETTDPLNATGSTRCTGTRELAGDLTGLPEGTAGLEHLRSKVLQIGVGTGLLTLARLLGTASRTGLLGTTATGSATATLVTAATGTLTFATLLGLAGLLTVLQLIQLVFEILNLVFESLRIFVILSVFRIFLVVRLVLVATFFNRILLADFGGIFRALIFFRGLRLRRFRLGFRLFRCLDRSGIHLGLNFGVVCHVRVLSLMSCRV